MAARDSRWEQDDPVKVPHRNEIGIKKNWGIFKKPEKNKKILRMKCATGA